MILRRDNERTGHLAVGNRTTLDELFRRAGVRMSDTLALTDPPNRTSFTSGAPRQLTFAQTDRAISALAAKLCRLGLQTDTVVAIQLANTVESIVTLLAVLRAGMIAAPLPLMWRKHDIVAALRNIGAKAIVTSTRIGTVPHGDIAMDVAAELFPIRFICAFGDNPPDGVVPLDDIFTQEQAAIVPRSARVTEDGEHPGDHVAAITFDVTPAGLVPVARSHMQLLAGGAASFLEAGALQNARTLSTIPPASFAGIAVTLLPWLTGGGTLSLHHGFDRDVFATQAQDQDTIVVPGPVLPALAQAGLFGSASQTVVALWRSPEQMVSTPVWRGPPALVDVACFGEIALLAARRGNYGLPADIPLGKVGAPRASSTVAIAETARGVNGTLLLRGRMVPVHAFPPGAERGDAPRLEADETGFVDTGFSCRLEGAGKTLAVTGPPGGIASVGGYRFRVRELEAQVADADPTATVVVLPGGLLAQKLAGSALDNAAVAKQLTESGANPLIAGAFRARGAPEAA
jgi:hypothetical protein